MFLVVDDDEVVARRIGQALGPYGPVVLAPTLTAAREALARHSICAIVLDVHLKNEEKGFALLPDVRALGRPVRVLVVTGDDASEHVNAAQVADVEIAHKPDIRANLVAFAERVRRAMLEEAAALDEEVAKIPGIERLTPRQREVIRAALDFGSHEEIAEQLGISANTVKLHSANALRQLPYASLHELVVAVYRAIARRG